MLFPSFVMSRASMPLMGMLFSCVWSVVCAVCLRVLRSSVCRSISFFVVVPVRCRTVVLKYSLSASFTRRLLFFFLLLAGMRR